MALAETLLSGALYLETRNYIKDQIDQFGYGGLSRGLGVAISAGVVLLTIWFMVQGYRIATGQSRESMAVFMVRAVTMSLIVAFAQGAAMYGSDLIDMVSSLQNTISAYITGGDYQSPENMIDVTLVAMQALQSQIATYAPAKGTPNAAAFITGMGQAMPALVSGGLLLLNQIALNLCFVFAPIFILCYLFEQTRPFFATWVKFTVTTLFSMAVITVVIIIAMKAILVVSATLLAADLASSGALQLNDIATVQGGLGMMMTTLILGTPPLVVNFFSGAVGAGFNGYNAFLNKSSGVAGVDQMLRQQHQGNKTVQQHGHAGAGAEKSAAHDYQNHNTKLTRDQNAHTNNQPAFDQMRAGSQSTHGAFSHAGNKAQAYAATHTAAALGLGAQAHMDGGTGHPNAASGAAQAAQGHNAQQPPAATSHGSDAFVNHTPSDMAEPSALHAPQQAAAAQGGPASGEADNRVDTTDRTVARAVQATNAQGKVEHPAAATRASGLGHQPSQASAFGNVSTLSPVTRPVAMAQAAQAVANRQPIEGSTTVAPTQPAEVRNVVRTGTGKDTDSLAPTYGRGLRSVANRRQDA